MKCSISCLRAADLLQKRAAGLRESDRLLLEQHLGACDSCAEDAKLMDDAAAVLRHGLHLPEASRQRIVASALNPASAPRARRIESTPVLWAAATAAIVTFGIAGTWAVGRHPEPAAAAVSGALRQLLATPRHIEQPALTIVSGSARASADGAEVGVGEALPHGRGFSLREPTVLQMPGLLAELAADSSCRWEPDRNTLVLEEGKVVVQVDPSRGLRFAVETPAFRAEVRGTVFEVSLDEVRVTRGRVVVHEGDRQHPLLAGESWTRAVTSAASPGARAQAVARPDASTLLADARRALARGDAAAARKLIAWAQAASPTRSERAEAGSLLAECSLVSGDRLQAQQHYDEVAREHAGTPAGETALFAQVRLERDPVRARAMLQDYLRRYPNGRFRAEALGRLQQLDQR